MERSAGGTTQAEKQQRGFKKKISRVFQRSKSCNDQDGEHAQTVAKGPSGRSPDSQAVGSGKKKSWGSWRQKKKSNEQRTDISSRSSEWMLTEQVTQDSEVVYTYDHVADIVQNTELEPQSPTSPKSPTGKSTKFPSIGHPGSGKAEEGRKKQVLDYLGGIFGSTRKKSVKNPSPVSLNQDNSVEESPSTTQDFSPSGESTSAGKTPDSGTTSLSQDQRSERVTEAEADQDLAETSQGSLEERGLLPAVGIPTKPPVSSPVKPGSSSKSVTIVDINLQSIHWETEKKTTPECVAEQSSPKTVSNSAKDFVTAFVGNVSNIFGSTLVNKEDTLTSACAAESLLSDDRSVKGCEIGELDTSSINENISQDTGQLKDIEFVNSDRLTEGQCDCETNANCEDIPAIKKCILPISETVRVEQVAEVTEVEIHLPKIKENSNVTLSEASVSLPVNNIGVELEALEKPLKNVELNQSAFQGFKKEIEIHNIPEKLTFIPAMAKQQNSSKKSTIAPDTKNSQVGEIGADCACLIGVDTATLLKVEQFATGNLSEENQNGVAEPESNTDKAVSSSLIDVVNSKNTAEKSVDMISGLNTDLSSATLVPLVVDKTSPTETKRGRRKGRRRRSLNSDQQSDRNTRNADTNTVEEALKETASSKDEVKPTQQSSEAPVKTACSPKQGASSLNRRKTLPKSYVFSEQSAQDVSKPFASRKNTSQRVPFSPVSGNKVESPVKSPLEKISNAETRFNRSETFLTTHSTLSGQKVENNIVSEISDSNLVVTGNGVADGATTDEPGEKMIALDSADRNSTVASVSHICNQQKMGGSVVKYSLTEQVFGADPGRLKTLKMNNSEEKSSNHDLITSQLHSLVTTRISFPSAEKEDASGALLSTSNQQGTCTEIRTEEEETIRITLPKKMKATSHHQVDFFATKDLPLSPNLNKKYIGSLKIQLHNKPGKRADATATLIGRRQPNTSKKVEASDGVNVEVRHKADEMPRVISAKANDTKYISAEEHKNKGINTSAHVEKVSLEMFPDVQSGRPEENCSLGMASSVLCAHTDVKDKSSSVDMHTSEMSLSEIKKDAPTKSVKEHKAHPDAATNDLVPSVPSTGAELQSREMEEKAMLPPSVLIYETTVSEIEKDAPTKSVNEQKAILGEAKSELAQPVQQNTPKVKNRDTEVKDTALPQKLQTPTTAMSDIKDINANDVGNRKGRPSAAIVKAAMSAQQSPSKSQPREMEIKDVATPQSTQMSESMLEIEKDVPAKSDNKRTSGSGAAKGELADQSSPILQISDSKTKSTISPQPVQMFKSTVSEIKKDMNANYVGEQQECLGTARVEGTSTVHLSPPQTQPGETEIKDASPQSVEVSQTEKVTLAKSFNEQRSGTDTITSDDVLPLQKGTISSKCKEKEINDVPSLCVQASKITVPEIKADTLTNSAGDTELGSYEATVALALPLQQNTPVLQNNDCEIKETTSLQSVQTFKTMGAEINKEAPAKRSNEQRSDILASDDFTLPIQTGTVDLTYRDIEVNDTSVCSQTSTTVSEIRKAAPENGASETKSGSSSTRGGLSLPVDQNMSMLQNRDFEIGEATLSQSVQTSRITGSEMNKDTSTTAAFEQKASPEAATRKFGLPLSSSTPEVQHKEMELKSAMSAPGVEVPRGNLSRTEGGQAASSIEQKLELGAATNEFSLSVQNVVASQPKEAVVKEASVADDTQTTKTIVGPIVDLGPSAGGFALATEQTVSKSEEGNKMNVSFNEDSSLDSSSDMDSFTETIRRYGNPIHLPQKRQRVPKVPFVPPFAMPPIQEDNISSKKEKIFDPSSFKFGLMKKSVHESGAPSSLLKMQQIETKSKVVKRVSAEQSLLFKSLMEKKSLNLVFQRKDDAENDLDSESGSKRSRLEADQTLNRISKPSTEPVIEPADLTPSLPRNDVVKGFEFDFSNPTVPETQLPSCMEKYLKFSNSETEKKASNSETEKKASNSEMEKQSENGLTIPHFKPNLLEININFGDITNTNELDSTPAFQGSDSIDANQNPPSLFNTDLFTLNSTLPYLPGVGIPGTKNLTLNPRPGKVVIYNQRNLCGEAIEVFHDVEDATSWKLPPEISIRVVRGCWLLFQKPNFEGGKIALEEGVVDLADIWGKEIAEDSCDDTPTSTNNESPIGSIRRVVKEWSLPEIDLCSELDGLGRKTTCFGDTEEIQTYGILEPTLSLEVFSGTWLLFEEPFYQGNSYIVEPGQYPCPESWDSTDSFIGSLKPLKMGTLKVEKLNDHKIIVYEKPFFEGKQLELKTDVFSFVGGDEESALCHTYPFAIIGSMKVLGGFWVGYEKLGFQGHQYALEEGEYQTWNDWGGYNEHLQSLRFIQVNFSTPVMIMYRETNFCEKSGNVEVLGLVPNLEDIDYGLRTKSINVLSGTWVAYENTDFTGEQYVLEKGLYSSYEDWGATDFKISSVQPVLMDMVDSDLSKFKVQFFSEPEFQGSAQAFDTDTVQFPAGFSPKSCKVQSGSWVAYDAENFTGNQYILEEGTYPDLMTVGCTNDACIKSVKTVGFCFSEPGIILFAREKFKGKKIELTSELLNLALQGYNSHIFSVHVNGGIWVAYECSNYRGRQILLQPCQIPNWHEHSGWHRIGSLRPLIQRRVYFRVRNRGTGEFMTLTGELNDIKMVRVQALQGTGMDDQIWFYQDGFIKSKVAEDCCLDVIGSLLNPGSRLGVSVQHSKDIHFWNVNSNGVILNGIRTDLVIDIKGGQHYDRNQTILNRFDEVLPTQRWDLEII
ncbi:beta/gamma crystallin domain-containing protein 1-like [Heptranchias perlo]|uniref:beta/gamma crystallin domain-containing protein 1-like n=1 Tax=Heptranchias perlo TaxID=212740 RepID=UPI003559A1DB